MTKLFTIVALSLALTGVANAGTYTDALRECGAKWRASDERKAVKKGEGMAAWQTYRATCTKAVGWESKRGRTAQKQ